MLAIEKIALAGAALFGIGGTVTLSYAPMLFPDFAVYGFWGGVLLLVVAGAMLVIVLIGKQVPESPKGGSEMAKINIVSLAKGASVKSVTANRNTGDG